MAAEAADERREGHPTRVPKDKRLRDYAELTAVLLLSATAILTAWAAFQSSKWGGAMSIAFSQASSARIEAARFDGVANRRINTQVGLFTQWAQASSADDQQLSDFLEERFPEPLDAAFASWLSTDPLNDPDAPGSPFEMPEYVIPESLEAEAADTRADDKFAEALENNQRGDNYTILAVVYAVVLFFAAMSNRVNALRSKWILLIGGLVLFLGATVVLLLMPRLL